MRFDMHCHTRAGSIDSVISIEKYITLLKEQNFDGMLITDHTSYRGYENWLKHKDEMPEFTVLCGIEYDTCDAGHFIIIMPDENCRPNLLRTRGMRLQSLIEYVHSSGGHSRSCSSFRCKEFKCYEIQNSTEKSNHTQSM